MRGGGSIFGGVFCTCREEPKGDLEMCVEAEARTEVGSGAGAEAEEGLGA